MTINIPQPAPPRPASEEVEKLIERLRVGLMAVAAFCRGSTDMEPRMNDALDAYEEAAALLRRFAVQSDGSIPTDISMTRQVFPDGTIYIGPLDNETGNVADTWIEGDVVVNDGRLDNWLRRVAPRLDDPSPPAPPSTEEK